MTRRRRGKPNYNSSVFINCPFDPEYQPLFRALVFTIAACNLWPRCALEVDDSGETRAEKLIRLIRESRYGIHDISRTEVNANQLPRFNMPYEFGLFVGHDIRSHRSDSDELIRQVRHWLQSQMDRDLPGAGQLVAEYHLFISEVPRLLAKLSKSETDLDKFRDFHWLVADWLEENRPPAARSGSSWQKAPAHGRGR